MSRILLVRHMPRSLSFQEKKEFLSQFGAENVWELRSRKDALFVSFPTVEIAKTNMFQLHQLEIGKRRLVVEYSDEIPKPKSPESQEDCTASQNMKRFLNDLYGFNPSLNFFQPPPPHLKYKYPDPTPTTFINIIYTLATVKPLYTQVLHLMNKMTLDPPFDENPEAIIYFNSMFTMQKSEAAIETRISSESESEISSEEESKSENTIVAKLPQRKHLLPKTIKRPSAVLSSITIPRKKAKVIDQKEVFEEVNLNEPKKICVNVSKDILDRNKVTEPEVVGEIGKIVLESAPQHQPEEAVTESKSATVKITREDIIKHRISYNDMKTLPVFKSYNPGQSSMRLYLKNLAKNVTEDDVRNLYKCYIESLPDLEQQGFDVRVMQEGRMKGQGFVTFPSVDIAKTALQETNGYMLNDRPMVVQFARVPNKKN